MHSAHTNLRRAGFTLVELVIVLATIALLAGIAVPRFGRATARHNVQAAAKRVAADLAHAQERARAASATCSVNFAPPAGSYRVTYPTVNGVAGSTITHDLTLPPFRSAVQTASFGSGGAILSFDGFGVPSNGGTVRVACGAEQRTITVAPVSGAVTIQ